MQCSLRALSLVSRKRFATNESRLNAVGSSLFSLTPNTFNFYEMQKFKAKNIKRKFDQ